MDNNPDNILLDLEGQTLTMTVDLGRVIGTTSNGKRARIASSHNGVYKNFFIGVNITRPFTPDECRALAAGRIPQGWDGA